MGELTIGRYESSIIHWFIGQQDRGGLRCVLKPLFHFSFFFLQLFHFFTLLIAPSTSLLPQRPSFLLVHPSSSSLLPPRPSFLLVPPTSSSLFLPRPALSESFRIRKWPFFIDLDESVTDGRTNGRADKASYRDARRHLKMKKIIKNRKRKKQILKNKKKDYSIICPKAVNIISGRQWSCPSSFVPGLLR